MFGNCSLSISIPFSRKVFISPVIREYIEERGGRTEGR